MTTTHPHRFTKSAIFATVRPSAVFAFLVWPKTSAR